MQAEPTSPSSTQASGDARDESVAAQLTQKILEVLVSVPPTREPPSADPHARARTLRRNAAAKSAAVSGTLSLPAGLVGMMTVVPDMVLVWRIQAQLVADIAGAFGKGSTLTREEILYCVFEHVVAESSLRGLVTRVGERYVVRRTTAATFRRVATRLGIRLAERRIGRTITRAVPLVGAAGVAWYAWGDTRRVGKSAVTLFEHDVVDAPSAT
ncbi:MAG TPA: hypothetical protein VHM19_22710 [Polyangiales bacterium]|jgi:uncharacterized protein (DUF697 family)|nr:hypothetical protein [Polyangiales bacterium]